MIQVCGGNIATVRAHIPSNTFKLHRTTIAATVLFARLLLTRTVFASIVLRLRRGLDSTFRLAGRSASYAL